MNDGSATYFWEKLRGEICRATCNDKGEQKIVYVVPHQVIQNIGPGCNTLEGFMNDTEKEDWIFPKGVARIPTRCLTKLEMLDARNFACLLNEGKDIPVSALVFCELK